jgi:hypothetical protein
MSLYLARPGKSFALREIRQLSEVQETGDEYAKRVDSMPVLDPTQTYRDDRHRSAAIRASSSDMVSQAGNLQGNLGRARTAR